VLTGYRPEVIHQRFHGIGQLDHLGVAVHLDIGPVEVVRQHGHARGGRATDVGRLGALRVAGDDDAAVVIDSAGHRRALQRPVGPERGEHHAMSRADEVEQFG
jgi:hypothetical protein